MTKYEYDKQTAAQMPALEEKGLAMGLDEIKAYTKDNPSGLYALIAPSLSYITLFRISSLRLRTQFEVPRAILDFISTDSGLKSDFGDIKYIRYSTKNEYVEIWIGNEHFALVDAEPLVVEI